VIILRYSFLFYGYFDVFGYGEFFWVTKSNS